MTAGRTSDLAFQLVDARGEPLRADLYRRVDAELKVGDRNVPVTVNTDGSVRARYKLEGLTVPASLPVSLQTRAVTVGGGVRLGPTSSTGRVSVALPPGFPTVTPAVLDFGSTNTLQTLSQELTVSGSDLGPTRACLAGDQIVPPGSSTDTSWVSAEDPCITIPAGQVRTLDLDLTPDVLSDGVATGDVLIDLEGASNGRTRLAVPTTLQMARPVDESTRWVLVGVLLLLALLVPALLLLASNVLLGRFVVAPNSRFARVPVSITPEGIRRVDDAAWLIGPDDLQNIAPQSGSRRFTMPGGGLTAKVTRLVSLRAPRGVATYPNRTLVSRERAPDLAPHRSLMPLGQVDACFVAVAHHGPDEAPTGELLLVIPQDVDAQGADERARALSRGTSWTSVIAQPPPEHRRTSGAPAAAQMPTTKRRHPEPVPQAVSAESDVSAHAPPSWLAARGDTPSSAKSAPPSLASTFSMSSDDLPPLPEFLRKKD